MHVNKLLIIPGVLVALTTVSGLLLSANTSHAEESAVDTLQVTVNTACTLSSSLGTTTGVTGTTDGEGNNSYSFVMDPGTIKEVNGSIFSTVCNDSGGYALYAIGYSNNSYDTNNTKMISTLDPANNINTGVAPASPTSSTPSSWAMMLAPVTSPSALTPPNIVLDFQSYHVVPATYTKIADYNAATASATAPGATAQAKYQVYISSSQAADTYTGKVKYTMVHPSTAPAPTPPVSFDSAYAAAGKAKLNNYYKMQDMSSTICDAVTLEDDESETTLIDSRDNKTYTVSKLKDGNCWMTQNLDHNIVTDGSVAYTSTTTDVLAAWTPSTATYPTGTTTWNASKTTPESYDPGTLYWNGTANTEYPSTEADCTAAGGTWDSVKERCNFISSTGNSHNHLGNYYNWTAAVAMNDSSSYVTNNQDVNQSICPANWTLPKSGNVTTSGSFQFLVTQYGWDSSSYEMENPYIWNSPIKASLSGYWTGSLVSVGYIDLYWSPMVNNSSDSYPFLANSGGGVNPGIGNNRSLGVSVRCLAR